MALKDLNLVRGGTNPAVTAYNPAPSSNYSGPPENEVGFVILGYLNSKRNVMLFQVNANVNTNSALNINTAALTDTLNVLDTNGLNTQQLVNYYTVDFGVDTSVNAWSLTFSITLKNGSTGSWIFTKGKSDDEKPKKA